MLDEKANAPKINDTVFHFITEKMNCLNTHDVIRQNKPEVGVNTLLVTED